MVEWVDLQTQATGEGTFVRYGDFGELIVSESGKERALYSEEVKLMRRVFTRSASQD